jgi:polyisoprenoid-binding protein YceI
MTTPVETLVEYEIDPKDSLFTVQAYASITHSPKFAIRNFSGSAMFVPGSLCKTSVRSEIAAESLEIQDEVSALDRREIERIMFREILRTQDFPKIIFESSVTKVNRVNEFLYRVHVAGALTLCGITRDHTFETQVTIGPDTLRANGSFTLLQTDYGIRPVTAAGGLLKVRDVLQFRFFITARR